MPCYKQSKGILVITKENLAKNKAREEERPLQVIIKSEHKLSNPSLDELQTMLQRENSKLDGAIPEHLIDHIVRKYETLENGAERYINLPLIYRGTPFRGHAKISNCHNKKDVKVVLPLIDLP